MSRIVRSAVPFVAGLAVFLNTAHAEEVTTAKSKPTVYNYISRESDPHDKAAESAYAKKFTIVEVRDRKQLTRAVLKEYVHPRPVLSESGQELKGRVAVMMIVTSDGRVVEPFILESTDRRLNTAALDAVRQWRFESGYQRRGCERPSISRKRVDERSPQIGCSEISVPRKA